RTVSGTRDHPVFLELSGHRCIDAVILRNPDVRDEYADQHSTQIANDDSRDCAGRNVCELVAVQAVLHFTLAAADGPFVGSQLRGALTGHDGTARNLAGPLRSARSVEMDRMDLRPDSGIRGF